MFEISELMTTNIVSIEKSTTLKEILRIFYTSNHHTIPVLEKNKPVGIVQWNNVFQILKPYPKYIEDFVSRLPFVPKELRNIFNIDLSLEISPEVLILCIANDVMETDFITVNEKETISEAYTKMQKHEITCVLVINDNFQLVGIISLVDIVMGILKKKGLL